MHEWTGFKEVGNLILFFDFLLPKVHTAVFIVVSFAAVFRLVTSRNPPFA